MNASSGSLARFAARSVAFARLETLRALRARMTFLGAAVFAGAHGVGRWQDASSDGFFVLGFIAAYALAFSPGLSADRGLSFDRLLVLDLLSPVEYALGKTGAMVAWIASLAALAWATAAIFSGGDVRFASWYTAMAALLSLLLLPGVVATDLFMRTRLPAAATLLLILVAVVLLATVGVEPPSVLGALGLLVTPYSYASLGPLVLRSCLACALAVVLVSLAAAARGWHGRTPPR